jgi:L-aspartate oxidase
MAPEVTRTDKTQVVVVGAGAAGLHAALRAAAAGAGVILVSRKPLQESSSYWAQGGLAAALAADDSPDRHAADTLAAGRGLCRPSAVQVLVEEAPAAVEWLREHGMRFDTEDPDGALSLGLEGGHTARRIVHAGGSETGRALTDRLATLVASEPRIDVREETSALALWSEGSRCAGVLTETGVIEAAATILATGGGAALWSRTTNPWGAIGAGPVLAHAAGAELADVEFCQFHPTALALPGKYDGTLITEAVRGEGATLLDAAGQRFTDELAPRDQVAAAVLDRMRADRSGHVLIDLRGLDPARFPNVFAAIERAGLDPRREPVPVAPAAHYLMGGITTDLDGRSTLPGLFAVGECACTGLHGANRLASNSLSECFVFGARAAAAAAVAPEDSARPALPRFRFEPPTVATREAMWRLAGPSRDEARLRELADDPYPLARLIAAAALERRESRGAHRRSDHPLPNPDLDGVHLVVAPDGSVKHDSWS